MRNLTTWEAKQLTQRTVWPEGTPLAEFNDPDDLLAAATDFAAMAEREEERPSDTREGAAIQ